VLLLWTIDEYTGVNDLITNDGLNIREYFEITKGICPIEIP